MGWDFLPNAINAILSLGPRGTKSVGTASSGGVCEGKRGERLGLRGAKVGEVRVF